MHGSNPFSRILFISIALFVMRGIFLMIVWRGGVSFGVHLKPRMLLLLSLGLLGIVATSFSMNMFFWKSTEILWAVLLWIIYALWVISPLLIARDLISFWHKIPPIVMIILSVLWVGSGIYYGVTIRTTPLSLSNPALKKDHNIVFISDLHVESVRNRWYIQKIVDRIQKIKPDFVILGGDLMNTAKASYVEAFLPFNQLKMPVYATLGNHDNMGDSDAVLQIFEKTKIKVLRNQSVDIDGIQVVGIDDKSYRNSKKLFEILDESNIASDQAYTILISHQPQKLSKLAGYPIDLELAGHTHNGQFFPFSLIIPLLNDYSYWTYRENGMTAFVSQGIGTWWAPIRIGTQSELVLISLKKAPATK